MKRKVRGATVETTLMSFFIAGVPPPLKKKKKHGRRFTFLLIFFLSHPMGAVAVFKPKNGTPVRLSTIGLVKHFHEVHIGSYFEEVGVRTEGIEAFGLVVLTNAFEVIFFG